MLTTPTTTGSIAPLPGALKVSTLRSSPGSVGSTAGSRRSRRRTSATLPSSISKKSVVERVAIGVVRRLRRWLRGDGGDSLSPAFDQVATGVLGAQPFGRDGTLATQVGADAIEEGRHRRRRQEVRVSQIEIHAANWASNQRR